MCSIEGCERHEYDRRLCLPHLKEAWIKSGELVIEEAPKRKSRKKKVDAVEVLTTDATEVAEERNDEELNGALEANAVNTTAN